MIPGAATPDGTRRYAARFPSQQASSFFRCTQSLEVSSLGIGTYLGEMDTITDTGYVEAIDTALASGINFIDTSLNYRNQRSELCIGKAIATHSRDEFVVCTKAGYLVEGAVPRGVLTADDIVAGIHSMAPAFLADQLGRSRRNLGLETIDVFYLHNPETQLTKIRHDEFYKHIREAFTFLEEAVAQRGIQYYGTATWNGYRRDPESAEGLSLSRIASIAREVAGDHHHFRFIQLPFNLGMLDAFTQRRSARNVLEEAKDLGITVIASASLLQARLSANLPDEIEAKLPGLATDAQRAIQFVRSTPGITVALTGMSNAGHVRENLGVAAVAPVSQEQYLSLYSRT